MRCSHKIINKSECYFCSRNSYSKRLFEKWWALQIKDVPEHLKNNTAPTKQDAFYVWKNAFIRGRNSLKSTRTKPREWEGLI